MQHIQNPLQELVKRLNLIGPDDPEEEYLLTKEEEDRLVEKAIKRAQEHYEWKVQKLLSAEEMEAKIASINWEEKIDRQSILQVGNMVKVHERWQKGQRIKEKEEAERKIAELKQVWDSRKMYQLMAWTSQVEYEKKLIVNADTKKLITALCFFVSRDSRFETELRYSFKKGLLIRGVSGLGKTHLVKCIEKNLLNPIKVLSMVEISEQVHEDGEYKIEMGDNKIVYLDDVGTEELVNHYGTKINFFKNFIETTYLRSKTFSHLMISTNDSFAVLEQKYGFRVRSRIKDMFNIVDVTGKDMRG